MWGGALGKGWPAAHKPKGVSRIVLDPWLPRTAAARQGFLLHHYDVAEVAARFAPSPASPGAHRRCHIHPDIVGGNRPGV